MPDEPILTQEPEFDLSDFVAPPDPGEEPEPTPAPATPQEPAQGLTDDLRAQALADAVASGQFVPVSALDQLRTPVQEPRQPQGNERPREEDFKDYSDYVDALTDWKTEQAVAKVTETFTRHLGEIAPVVAGMAGVSFVQEVPAEAQYAAREIAQGLGTNVSRLTPEQRQTLQDAAIGRAHREGKLTPKPGAGYTPEPVTQGGGGLTYADGKGPSDVQAMAQLYGRPLTKTELKELMIIR